jgi:hypothetical protein
VALAVLLLALSAFAFLGWQAPLVAVSALGFPLVFLIYMYEAVVYRDLPSRSLVLAAMLGIGLGVGWALLTGGIVADAYDVALGAEELDVHSVSRVDHPRRRCGADAATHDCGAAAAAADGSRWTAS